ncbi:glycosyltransferase [Sediminibacillus massiliensis]|uniref:glycosyltransferase n=1 Tax=Sediminibacillus massiliensis TaxID=1926277 RepID=UPI0015C313DF|nr:glycosyltransferase family 2 protein [Sediminibacillus massiliensis]
MIVKDEEELLGNCLSSAKEIVSEIIVVDTGSIDSTPSIAERFGAKVIHHPWQGDFSEARNAGLDHATGEWILILDADEELNPDSIDELKNWKEYNDAEGFFLRIYNHFGEKGKEASINPTIRMFRNSEKHRFSGSIHEQIAESIQQNNPSARFVMTDVIIDHYGYQANIREKKNKTKRNITLLKKELETNPDHPFHLYNIGIEYMQLNDYENALLSFRKSRELVGPKVNYAHLLFKCEAKALGALGRLKEAIAVCDAGVDQYPDYTDLHHYKGTYQITMGDSTGAEKSFRRAIQLQTASKYHTETGIGSFATYYLLALVCESQSKDDQAIDNYLKSFKESNNEKRPLYRIFQLLRSTDRESEIPSLLKKRFKMHTENQKENLLHILLRSHCYQSVCTLLDDWLSEEPLSFHTQEKWRRIKEDCVLMYSDRLEKNKNTDQFLPLTIDTDRWRAHFPENSDLFPPIESLPIILEIERKGRILYKQGFYSAFQQYLKKWKGMHQHVNKDYQSHSVIQLVQTLSFNAEEHLNSVLKKGDYNLIRSAKTTLPFEEGWID